MRRVLVGLGVLVLVAAGCTSDKQPGPTRERTVTSVATQTRTATPNPFTPAPATTVRPLRPGKKPPKGEKNATCPYIRTGLDQDPTNKPNVADIEGNRIARTTVLTHLHPVGCRFYFIGPPYQATADILPRTFSTPADAHNAMVLTARAGKRVRAYPDFVPGVDGINYQTKFFGEDGANDWAFVFAKGRTLVVVHTEQDDSPLNALYLAKAIVGKF